MEEEKDIFAVRRRKCQEISSYLKTGATLSVDPKTSSIGVLVSIQTRQRYASKQHISNFQLCKSSKIFKIETKRMKKGFRMGPPSVDN